MSVISITSIDEDDENEVFFFLQSTLDKKKCEQIEEIEMEKGRCVKMCMFVYVNEKLADK